MAHTVPFSVKTAQRVLKNGNGTVTLRHANNLKVISVEYETDRSEIVCGQNVRVEILNKEYDFLPPTVAHFSENGEFFFNSDDPSYTDALDLVITVDD